MKKKKDNYTQIVENITNEVMKRLLEKLEVSEGNGFDNIFQELKKNLEKIEILPDSKIDASYYTEKQITDVLKKSGYEYKKAFGNKMHFFNKQTSISLYIEQPKNIISLTP
jgi:hypothetical protein